MKQIQALVVSAALAIGMAAPASAGVNDPEVIIYRFPGVADNGNVATAFHCTNFSGADEIIRFVTRNGPGNLTQNKTTVINHLETRTAVTHSNAAYSTDLILTTGKLLGSTAIAATSTNVICTAMSIDAANPVPTGVALRGIRFNPVAGSQE